MKRPKVRHIYDLSTRDYIREKYIHMSLFTDFSERRGLSAGSLTMTQICKIFIEKLAKPRETFLGKVDHTNADDKFYKSCFLFACYFYVNDSEMEIAEFMGCSRCFVKGGTNSVLYRIRWENLKYFDFIHSLLIALEEASPGRLQNLFPISIDSITSQIYYNGIGIQEPSKISLKNSFWAIDHYSLEPLLIYKIGDTKYCRVAKNNDKKRWTLTFYKHRDIGLLSLLKKRQRPII